MLSMLVVGAFCIVCERPVPAAQPWLQTHSLPTGMSVFCVGRLQVVELDELADGSKVQEALASVTGRRTVPQVGGGLTRHVPSCWSLPC